MDKDTCPDTYLITYNPATRTKACTQVDYHTLPPEADTTLWFSALALAFGMLVALYGAYHSRPKCRWCNARHPKRHTLMTTEEYLRLYCGGWAAHLRELESRDAKG